MRDLQLELGRAAAGVFGRWFDHVDARRAGRRRGVGSRGFRVGVGVVAGGAVWADRLAGGGMSRD